MWKAACVRSTTRTQIAKYRKFSSTKKTQHDAKKPPIPIPNPQSFPPLPPRREGGALFFKLLGLTTVAAGGFVGYLWYDPTFRQIVEDNVPYSKEALQFIFNEGPTEAVCPSDELPPEIEPKTIKKPSKKPKEDVELEPLSCKSDINLKPGDHITDIQMKRRVDQCLKEKEAERKEQNASLQSSLETLMADCKLSLENAIEAQKSVVSITKKHTDQLRKAMDDTSEIMNKNVQWEAVSCLFHTREEAVAASRNSFDEVKTMLDKLRARIEEGKANDKTSKNRALIPAHDTANKLASRLRCAINEVTKAESEAKIMTNYKDLVEKGRKQFKEELESIMPEVKIGRQKGQKMTEEELNSLIAHAHRRIEQLQKQLAEQLLREGQNIEIALEEQMNEAEKVACDKVQMETEKRDDDIALEKDKWAVDAQAEFEINLRHQLSRQAAAHSDHIKDVLLVQQSELDKQFEKAMHIKILQERKAFQTEVAGWIARLKGIEAAVDSRAESEQIARVAQELWLTCVALNGKIRLGNECAKTWEGRLMPLEQDIIAISDASCRHPFVETVIRTLPEEALKRGVWTEESLQERFCKVKRICKRVALIDEAGGGLVKYLLSYVQSMFIFDTVCAKSMDDEISLDELDTFTILSNADFWIKKGELEQALKFLNHLEGEPRRVASDWVKEAQLTCETRQAAYVLMAFASASGLGTLF